MKTRVLTRADVDSVLTMKLAVDAVESAFAAHGRGDAHMPAKVYLDLPDHQGDFRAMPAALDGAAGVKWVNSHPHNPERFGLPAVMGVFVLSDPATAFPLAVLDATALTAARTGAAGAVAARYLARRDARTVGFVGCGVQARTLWAALRVALDRPLDAICADANAEAADRFAAEIGGSVGSVQDAAGCDIVCTATPSRAPILDRAWVRPGTHINAMGADAPGKQELDPELLAAARVVIDDPHQALTSGEVNAPIRDGRLTPDAVATTLGAIVAGRAAGRTHDDEITVFDSTGLAIQDVALARAVVRAAADSGVGIEVDLVGVGDRP
ncbi:MAG: ornithine cyclodeaminase family protein [Deltaproteobacteria bacterium]|nr:MAG: ornithine cyclodeaminase family protein [Deltaproteobacteria bacterium]